jgi:transposase
LTPAADTLLSEDPRQLNEQLLGRMIALQQDKCVLEQEKTALEQENLSLKQECRALEQKYERALQKVKDYFNKLFRPRSEKLNENQMELIFEALLDLGFNRPQLEVVEEEVFEKPRPVKTKRAGGREALPKNLPVERIETQLAEGTCCSSCGGDLTRIREEVSKQLEYVPASFKILEHVRGVYACRSCEETVATTPKAQKVIDKGLPGPSLLAHVTASKYAYHQPLYRLSQMFSHQGVDISRSTLCDWMAAAADLIDPLYQFLYADLKKSRIIQTDSTGITVLKVGLSPGSRKGQIWVYSGDRDHPHILFDFTLTKESAGPRRFLDGFKGPYLQADAASGYDFFFTEKRRLLEVACWAHTRRYFFEAALKAGDKRALIGVGLIDKLFLIERELKELSDEERRTQRELRAGPILDQFNDWLLKIRPSALPKSPLGQAVGYALNQAEALRRYLEDGQLSLDNNASERALRPIAVGRKNWLFAASPGGGVRAAKIFSLIESAKRHHLDPFAYLRDIFQLLPNTPPEKLHELAPAAWAVRSKNT